MVSRVMVALQAGSRGVKLYVSLLRGQMVLKLPILLSTELQARLHPTPD